MSSRASEVHPPEEGESRDLAVVVVVAILNDLGARFLRSALAGLGRNDNCTARFPRSPSLRDGSVGMTLGRSSTCPYFVCGITSTRPTSMNCPPRVCRQWTAMTFLAPGLTTERAFSFIGRASYPVR